MSTEIKVPQLGESVSEATVAKWLKKAGEAVAADEPIVELETDKVTLEVNAPAAGALEEIIAEEGADVEVGAVLAMFKDGASGLSSAAKADKKEEKKEPPKEDKPEKKAPGKEEQAPVKEPPKATGQNPRRRWLRIIRSPRPCAAWSMSTSSIRKRFRPPARTAA